MKPAPFDYVRAGSLAEAHDVLAAEGSDAAILAGGQSLVPLLSMRMARPKVLIDIIHVGELGGLRVEDDAIHVGACVRQAELLAWPDLAKQPLLAQVLPWIGHWQTRARGTDCRALRARPDRGGGGGGAGGALSPPPDLAELLGESAPAGTGILGD